MGASTMSEPDFGGKIHDDLFPPETTSGGVDGDDGIIDTILDFLTGFFGG